MLTQQLSTHAGSSRLWNASSQPRGCSHPPRSHCILLGMAPHGSESLQLSVPEGVASLWETLRFGFIGFSAITVTPELNSNKLKHEPNVCIELGCARARNIQWLQRALQLIQTDQNTLHQDRNPTQTLLERIWSKLRASAPIYAREKIISSSSDPPTFQKGDLQDGTNSLCSESVGGALTHRHQR